MTNQLESVTSHITSEQYIEWRHTRTRPYDVRSSDIGLATMQQPLWWVVRSYGRVEIFVHHFLATDTQHHWYFRLDSWFSLEGCAGGSVRWLKMFCHCPRRAIRHATGLSEYRHRMRRDGDVICGETVFGTRSRWRNWAMIETPLARCLPVNYNKKLIS